MPRTLDVTAIKVEGASWREELASFRAEVEQLRAESRIGLGRHHERTGRPACAEIISCVLFPVWRAEAAAVPG